MSESMEVVEITDTSIRIESFCESKVDETLELEPSTKRRTPDDGDIELVPTKKMRTEEDEGVQSEISEITTVDGEAPVEVTENVIPDAVIPSANESTTVEIEDESKTIESEDEIKQELSLEISEDNILELNVSAQEMGDTVVELEPEEDELFLEEIHDTTEEVIEDQKGEAEDEEIDEDVGGEEFEESEPEEEPEGSSDEDDDEAMLANAVKASTVSFTGQSFQADDEPIALDDSDDEENPNETSRYQDDSEHSSEFSVENEVELGDSDEEIEDSPEIVKKLKSVSQQLYRKLVKKSRRILTVNRVELKKTSTEKEEKEGPTKVSAAQPENKEKPKEISNAALETNNHKVDPKAVVESMEISDDALEVPPELPPPIVDEEEHKTLNNDISQSNGAKMSLEKKESLPVPPAKMTDEKNEKTTPEKEKAVDSNDSSRHDSSLLAEISNSNIEEIFNRYVLNKTNEQSPTLDEFSEELFFCMQQNKQEIEKAQQLWNEKLHVKFKIRELMETIRRHRAVMEIDTFGYKPEANAGNNSNHPVISSKSSTTTNSEADHYEKHFRMSSESVSRLIQDVRASMLKRDEKQRFEELTGVTNSTGGDGAFDANSFSSQWNSLQGGGPQGRQGQIVDVQSIINDFRQKNPQEIPRRGRRMKGSYGGSFFDNQQMQMEENRASRNDFMPNVTNNSSHDFNNAIKANAGYPEVSLHPVQNLYKNLSSSPGSSGAAHFSGQKSSLLQSILTKQSTKSPVGFHQNHSALPTTSTLARLLTAPERSFQGSTPKHSSQPSSRQASSKGQSSNGEITITPIGANNSRNKDFSMEDEENSMEPPLVIDETEDFESSDRPIKSVSDLLCQGCKKNKAFFMCAGCSQQWYCSKECQEMAWDEHAEHCLS